MSFGYPRYGGRRHNVLADILGGLLQGGTNFLQARQQTVQQQRTQKQEDEDRAYQKQYHDLQMQQMQEQARQQRLAPGLGEFQTLRQQYPSPEAQTALSHQQSQYQTGGYTGEPGAGLTLGKTAQQIADEEAAQKSQNALYAGRLQQNPEHPDLIGQAYQGTLPGGAGVPFKPQMLAGLLSGLPGLSTPVPTGAALPTGQRYTPGEVLQSGGATQSEREFTDRLAAQQKTATDKTAAQAERDRMRALERQGTEQQKAVAKLYNETYQDTYRFTGDDVRARDAARYAADGLGAQLEGGGAGASPAPDQGPGMLPPAGARFFGGGAPMAGASGVTPPRAPIRTPQMAQMEQGDQRIAQGGERIAQTGEIAARRDETQRRGQDMTTDNAVMRDTTTQRGQILSHEDRQAALKETTRAHNLVHQASMITANASATRARQAGRGGQSPAISGWREQVRGYQHALDATNKQWDYYQRMQSEGDVNKKPEMKAHATQHLSELAPIRQQQSDDLEGLLKNPPSGAAPGGASPASGPAITVQQKRREYADTLVHEYKYTPAEAQRKAALKYK